VSSFNPVCQSPADILEALTLVNSIYADETTIVKPSVIAKTLKKIATEHAAGSTDALTDEQLMQLGASYALGRAGVPALFCGHNPHNKLADQGIDCIVTDSKGVPILIHTDGGMAQKFGDKGVVILVKHETEPQMLVSMYQKEDNVIVVQECMPLNGWTYRP
jgi:hypothetical protein